MKRCYRKIVALSLCILLILCTGFTHAFADLNLESHSSLPGQSPLSDSTIETVFLGESLGTNSETLPFGQSSANLGTSGNSIQPVATPFNIPVTDISNDAFSYLILYNTGFTHQNGTYLGPLDGAIFELYKRDDADNGSFKPYIHDKDANNGVYVTNTQTYPMYVSTTNSIQEITRNGVIHIGQLPHGTYRLVQIQAASGYASPSLNEKNYAEFKVGNVRDPAMSATDYTTTFNNYLVQNGGVHFTVVSSRLNDYILFRHPDLARLPGAVFEVDKNENGTWETLVDSRSIPLKWTSDLSGYVQINTLEIGYEYRLRQVESPPGFLPITNDNSSTRGTVIAVFKPTQNPNQNLIDLGFVNNEPQQHYFKIKATDEANPVIGIPGIRYSVYVSANGSETLECDWIYYRDLIDITDADGIVSFSLPYMPGITFRLAENTELSTNNNYLFSSNNTYQSGVINLDRISGSTDPSAPYAFPVYYAYKNITATITLMKHDDADVSIPLANANFLLYQKQNNTWTIASPYSYVTNQDGKIFVELPPGTYRFQESSPPPDYEIIGDGITSEFTISGAGDLTIPWQAGNTLYVANQFDTSSLRKTITGVKVDADTQERLAGAVFSLEKEDEKGNFSLYQGDLTTDSNGEVIMNLPYGNYRLWEVAAPGGYILSGGYTAFAIDDFTPDDGIRYISNSKQVPGATYATITIVKHCTNNPSHRLSDAEFVLEQKYNGVWNEYLHGIITSSEGQAQVGGLPAGEYRFREVSPPSGYQISAENSYAFLVASDGYEQDPSDFNGTVVTPSKTKKLYIANVPVNTNTGSDKYPGTNIMDPLDRGSTFSPIPDTEPVVIPQPDAVQTTPENINDNPGTGK